MNKEIKFRRKLDLIKFNNGELEIDVKISLEEDTVWLSQKDMGILFGVKHNTLSEHIKNVFLEEDLDKSTSVGISDRSTGGRRPKLYNGYIPAYKRSVITDSLHECFGFRTDYEVISKKRMRNIIKNKKK